MATRRIRIDRRHRRRRLRRHGARARTASHRARRFRGSCARRAAASNAAREIRRDRRSRDALASDALVRALERRRGRRASRRRAHVLRERARESGARLPRRERGRDASGSRARRARQACRASSSRARSRSTARRPAGPSVSRRRSAAPARCLCAQQVRTPSARWRDVARESNMSRVVDLRLPLVYGPRVRGNFLALLARGRARRAAAVRRASPTGAHLLYVGNLVHAIVALVDAPAHADGAWLVADGEAVSTPELVRAIGHGAGASAACSSPCRSPLLAAGAAATGRRAIVAAPRRHRSKSTRSPLVAAHRSAAVLRSIRASPRLPRWWRAYATRSVMPTRRVPATRPSL